MKIKFFAENVNGCETIFCECKRTFVTYLLYQHSQYTAFYRPNKTEVMIITPGKSVTMGDVKTSKTDVKRAVAG